MSHLVLARKYRPKNFEGVVGQEFVVSLLKASIKQNRIAHALLFTGGRGVGKTTIARIVAKSLVCLSNDEKPCNACIQCQSVDNFSSLDVIEIDGASHTGVDDVREIRESAKYRPTSAKYKIFIIDEVHMLSQSAFNALLKILEEPPEHVIFIFATTESHKIPKTILSRCQRYDFKRSSDEAVFENLKSILAIEKKSFDDDAIRLIAKLADGSMRDSLSILEQVLNLEESHYTAKHVSDLLGVIDHQVIKDLVHSMLSKKPEQGFLLIKSVYEQGFDLCQLMDGVCERIRFLSLIANIKSTETLARITPEISDADKKEVQEYDPKDLKRCFSMALDGLSLVFSSKKPLLALELFLLKISQRADLMQATDINYYLQKLDALLQKKPIFPNAPAIETQKIPVVNEVKNQTSTDLVNFFLNKLKETQPGLMAHIRHAKARIDQQTKKVILNFDNALHYNQAIAFRSDERLVTLFKQIFKEDFVLEFTKDETIAQSLKDHLTTAQKEEIEEKRKKQELYDDAANHPLVKKTLDILGGKIVNVELLSK